MAGYKIFITLQHANYEKLTLLNIYMTYTYFTKHFQATTDQSTCARSICQKRFYGDFCGAVTDMTTR